MKKKAKRPLSLHKQTVRDLSPVKLDQADGGGLTCSTNWSHRATHCGGTNCLIDPTF